MCSLFQFVLYFLLITVIVNSQRSQRGQRLRLCSIVNIQNAVVRFKHNSKIMRINCVPGFTLQGSNIVACENGKWNAEIPVCTKEGCPRPETPQNGLVMPTRFKANLYCKENYKLLGGRITYCNGSHWDRPLGKCQETSDKIQLTCDFESDDLCGWSHDETHNFDWKRIMAANLFQHLRTGPQHDHTTFTANSGHYMLMESFDQLPDTVARLISPIYPKALIRPYGCFRFFYFMYGAAVGSLNVYIKPISIDIEQVLQESSYKHFGVSGNQKNIWKEGFFIIKQSTADFQIIIEGTAGVNHLSDIAIDDVQLMEFSECVAAASTSVTKSPEFTDYAIFDVQSCEGRCSETSSSNFGLTNKNGVFYKSCDCHEECETLNTCCPNFRSICEFGNTADQTTIEGVEPVTLLPSIMEYSKFQQATINTASPSPFIQIKTTSTTPTTSSTTTSSTTSTTTTTITTSFVTPAVKESTINPSKYGRLATSSLEEINTSESEIPITTNATSTTTEITTTTGERKITLEPRMVIQNHTKLHETTSTRPVTSSRVQRIFSNVTKLTELNPITENISILRKDKLITWQIPKKKIINQNKSISSSIVLTCTLIAIIILIVILAIKNHKIIKKFKQRHLHRYLKGDNEDATVLIYNQNTEL